MYITKGKALYTYVDEQFRLFADLSATSFLGARFGRTEKDIFCHTTEGLGHFNGADLQIIYNLPPDYRMTDMMVFPSDLFFMCIAQDYNSGIVVHGKLEKK